jgi:hypothetical protein
MYRSDWEAVLDAARSAALDHLNSLLDRPVYPQGSYPEILAALDHPPTDTGVDAAQVIHELGRVSRSWVVLPVMVGGCRVLPC